MSGQLYADGGQRYWRNRANGIEDKAVALPGDPEWTDRTAAAAEHFAARAMGIPFRPADVPDKYDLRLPDGRLVDVKWTPKADGRLLRLLDAKSEADIYVLVTGQDAEHFVWRGWATKERLFASIIDLGHGPTYGLRQDQLEPGYPVEEKVSENKALQVARDNYVAVRQEISDKATSELTKLLSPEKAERFVAIGLRSLAKNPDLLTATPKSLTNAFYDAAVLGLEPVLGSVYFVKYGSEATMLIGYRGLVELAKRGDPDIEDIYGQPVYEGDEFTYEYGDNPHLKHKPDLTRQTADPTKITHFYGIAFRGRGRPVFAVMTRDEVDAIRARSRAKNSGPWVTDYAAMGSKTVVRQLCSRRLSLSADIREALERDVEREYAATPAAEPLVTGTKAVSLKEALKAQAVAVEIAGEVIEVEPDEIINADEVAEGAPVVVTPRPSADPQTNGATAKCKDVSPYGSGALCDRQAGHGGSHMSGTGKDKEAW